MKPLQDDLQPIGFVVARHPSVDGDVHSLLELLHDGRVLHSIDLDYGAAHDRTPALSPSSMRADQIEASTGVRLSTVWKSSAWRAPAIA